MTIVSVPAAPPVAGRATRCCAVHPDWPTLAQHLLEAFPDVTITDVVRELRQARDAVERVSLESSEALDVAETLVRHRLAIATGRLEDVARLDPQTRR